MNKVMQPAGGASAFTQADRFEFEPAAEGTLISLSGRGDPKERWDALIDELLRIRNFQDDWDAEGSEAPHPALVDGAITLAQCLKGEGYPPADRVVASVNGTVYFEWHSSREYQEIEVTSPLGGELRRVPKGSSGPEVFALSWGR